MSRCTFQWCENVATGVLKLSNLLSCVAQSHEIFADLAPVPPGATNIARSSDAAAAGPRGPWTGRLTSGWGVDDDPMARICCNALLRVYATTRQLPRALSLLTTMVEYALGSCHVHWCLSRCDNSAERRVSRPLRFAQVMKSTLLRCQKKHGHASGSQLLC